MSLRNFAGAIFTVCLTGILFPACNCEQPPCPEEYVKGLFWKYTDSVATKANPTLTFYADVQFGEINSTPKKRKLNIKPCYKTLQVCNRVITRIPVDSIFISSSQYFPGFPAGSLLNNAPFVYVNLAGSNEDHGLVGIQANFNLGGFNLQHLPDSTDLTFRFRISTGELLTYRKRMYIHK
ncbi:MAG: hypothetical protein JNL57_04170 [Bacteroidetes bacterium]|nr:hypothetical protein [Bacteroidota bacterium]